MEQRFGNYIYSDLNNRGRIFAYERVDLPQFYQDLSTLGDRINGMEALKFPKLRASIRDCEGIIGKLLIRGGVVTVHGDHEYARMGKGIVWPEPSEKHVRFEPLLIKKLRYEMRKNRYGWKLPYFYKDTSQNPKVSIEDGIVVLNELVKKVFLINGVRNSPIHTPCVLDQILMNLIESVQDSKINS